MNHFSTPIATRPAFVDANPTDRAAHRAAQRAMFGAANRAGLGTSDAHRDAMIDGVNAAFGLRGSQRIVSRRQMTVSEQQAIAVAIEAGLFGPDWIWSADFTISRCEVQTVTLAATAQRTVLHFSHNIEPLTTDARVEMFRL